MSKRSDKRKVREQFYSSVLEADGWRCNSPWCEKKYPMEMDDHHLLGKNYNDVKEGITLCRVCHTKCEEGFSVVPRVSLSGYATKRITGREHEIAILEHIKEHRPEHFRWEKVLEEFYRKRKVV